MPYNKKFNDSGAATACQIVIWLGTIYEKKLKPNPAKLSVNIKMHNKNGSPDPCSGLFCKRFNNKNAKVKREAQTMGGALKIGC